MFTITWEVNAMDILIGILILVLGASVATMGLRLWFWMLPILGFMTGFFLGAIFILGLVGDGILETALSWIVGIIAGIAFALISWFWWYFGVIIASASAGASLVTAIVASFGVDNDWALLLISILGAVLFAFVALMLALPLYIVIASTAIAGGIGVVSGLLLVFDQIHISDLGEGNAVAVINNSGLVASLARGRRGGYRRAAPLHRRGCPAGGAICPHHSRHTPLIRNRTERVTQGNRIINCPSFRHFRMSIARHFERNSGGTGAPRGFSTKVTVSRGTVSLKS